MPPKQIAGHETNIWYDEAIKHAMAFDVSNGKNAKVISPGYFVATKLVTLRDRGNIADLLGMNSKKDFQNKGLEDIVLLFDLLSVAEIFDSRLSESAKSYVPT